MNRRTGFLIYLAILSILSGFLMSKASLIGKAGMSLFYREYNFLKAWWKGALVVCIFLMLLFFIHSSIQKRMPARKVRTMNIIALLTALVGLYFTYYDFRHTLSHHLLGERFHLGVYLFWLGWISICVFFLTGTSQTTVLPGTIAEESRKIE